MFWQILEGLGDVLEALGGVLDACGSVLEASWRQLEALESVLEALEVVLKAMLGQDSSGNRETMKNKRKNNVFGPPARGILDVLEALGRVLEGLEGALEASWKFLETS